MLAGAQPLEILIRLMFIGVGGFLLLVALWIAGNNLYIISTYEHARAEVLRCDRTGPVAVKGLNHYEVSVRFDGPNGRTQTASIKDAVTNYDVGELVDVYYKPETAYTVIGGDFMQMWFHATGIGIASILLLGFGLRPARRPTS
jgi:hypothetical protein